MKSTMAGKDYADSGGVLTLEPFVELTLKALSLMYSRGIPRLDVLAMSGDYQSAIKTVRAHLALVAKYVPREITSERDFVKGPTDEELIMFNHGRDLARLIEINTDEGNSGAYKRLDQLTLALASLGGLDCASNPSAETFRLLIKEFAVPYRIALMLAKAETTQADRVDQQ
ncbi:MAG: hypothetical protein NTX24_04170 [Candidatus Pacearchaeota archaeon]|nr:hypothetical protein [Candidatus Pacearchaeota archaeon]